LDPVSVCVEAEKRSKTSVYQTEFGVTTKAPFSHILALLKNSTEAGNLLRRNDALHAMLGARTRARMQSVLVAMMFICLIARLLN
jgi:hypothetical protein